MQKQLNAVKEFHTAFKLGVSHNMKGDLGEQKNLLRFNLMKEENEEYLEAVQNNDLIEIADALGDMLYILCGTILEHGLQLKIEEVFDEIQRSNMSKLGEDGNPIYREDGKVLKGPNYFKPSFEEVRATQFLCIGWGSSQPQRWPAPGNWFPVAAKSLRPYRR